MNSLKTKRILEENIQALKTNDGISVQKFGVKAVSLNKYSTLFNWIPNGYVISSNLVLKIANDEINLEEQMILKNHFNFLIKHSDTLILRSSSSLEWVNGNSFAGLFKTIGSINSFDYFLESLKVAFFHSNSKEIKNYADLKSTVLPKNHIGFILQEEIKVINSALLILDNKTHYIEFFDGDIKQAVSGNISPVFTLLSKEQQIVKQEGVLPKINIIQEIILIIEKIF